MEIMNHPIDCDCLKCMKNSFTLSKEELKKFDRLIIDLPKKMEEYKEEAYKCYQLGDYKGSFKAFTKMNNLMPPKYRIKLEPFNPGDEF